MTGLEATYFDGHTAEPHSVSIRLEVDGLVVAGADGARFVWSRRGLVPTPFAGAPGVVRVGHRDAPDARLVVSGGAASALVAWAPELRRDGSAPGAGRRLAAWAVVSIGLAAAVFVGGRAVAKPLARMLPASWEEQLGHAVRELVVRSATPVAEGRATRAVEELAVRLDPAAAGRVELVAGDTENAFALPGGRVVVYCGLVRELKSPDELAAIVAHELAHGQARHPTAALLRVMTVAVLVGAVTGDMGGQLGGGEQLVEGLVRTAHSRDDEAEADALGRGMLRRAGLSTAGFASFFGRRASSHGSLLPAFLSTHPSDAARAHGGEEEISSPAMAPAAWAALRWTCSGGDAVMRAATNALNALEAEQAAEDDDGEERVLTE